MIFRLILFSCLYFYSYSCFCQDSTGRINEKFLKAVTYIVKPSTPTDKMGTGFLVACDISDSIRSFFLVTNKHVIGDWSLVDPFVIADYITVDFYSTKTGLPISERIRLKDSQGKLSPFVKVHPNPKVDVAIINVTPAMLRNKEISHFALDTSYLLRLSHIKEFELGFGSQVFAIGYPADQKIAGTNQAIAKSTYIASSVSGTLQIFLPVTNKFGFRSLSSPEGTFFLVDGLIVGGNSGGPVVNPNEYKWRKNGDNWAVTREKIPNLILGIISGGLPGSGITVVYSSDNILELIESFISDIKSVVPSLLPKNQKVN